MSSTNGSSYLTVANGHIDSLIDYVLDVKPYHVKLAQIVEEYLFREDVNVKIDESHQILAFLGADIMPATATFNTRARRTSTWVRDVVSDGSRRIWPAPLTYVHKFAYDDRSDKFVAGVNDSEQIPGLTSGVFDVRRWEGPGITNVSKNGQHQQDTVDYFLSYGAFSFDTFGSSTNWQRHRTVGISGYGQTEGSLYYNNCVKPFGKIKNIVGGNYEEWTVRFIDDGSSTTSQPDLSNTFTVEGSQSGVIATHNIQVDGLHFSHALITFDYELNADYTTGSTDDTFILTPAAQITVEPSSPAETWSIIKTNPIALTAEPQFVPITPRAVNPTLTVHTFSLVNQTTAADWIIRFTSATQYHLIKNDVIIDTVDLADGLSYKSDEIHFTITRTTDAFAFGDEFIFSTAAKTDQYHFKVFGSVSGWQADAKLNSWYWNGKIGFKIPSLEYFAVAYNSTINISVDGTSDSWHTVVSNQQIFKSVEYQNGAFLAVGEESIVAASVDGISWTSDITTALPPTGSMYVITGENGLIATSTDGVTWVKQASNTSSDMHASTNVPNFLTPIPPATQPLSCIVAVGDNGTIYTSVTGEGWSEQISGTSSALRDVVWAENNNASDLALYPTATKVIIAVGDNGTIVRSCDRTNWEIIASNTTNDLRSVIYEETSGAFIAVGSYGTILRSTDSGRTWNNLGAFTYGEFSDVAYGEGKFVAVSTDGWVAESSNGIVWTRYRGKSLNGVTYGAGVFVGVGGKDKYLSSFTSVKDVHPNAEPSTYTITFTSDSTATVQNSKYGFGAGLKLGEVWSDAFVSFKIESNIDTFTVGDQIMIHTAPKTVKLSTGSYDLTDYEFGHYDELAEISLPLLMDQEVFPLEHAYGAVIFSSTTSGDLITINKAFKDIVRFKIDGASQNFPELAPQHDWIPLEFKMFDTASSAAEFSDLTTTIEAYSAANPDVKVFTISQPEYQSSGRLASAALTFDPAFFAQYLRFNTKYTLFFLPEEQYGNTIRVKITEGLHSYNRFKMNLFEGPQIGYWQYAFNFNTNEWELKRTSQTGFDFYSLPSVGSIVGPAEFLRHEDFPAGKDWGDYVNPTPFNISVFDAPIQRLEIIYNMAFVDTANITVTEGGALPFGMDYDSLPYDVSAYDLGALSGVIAGVTEVSPGVFEYTGVDSDWIMPKATTSPSMYVSDSQDTESAPAQMVESFMISERDVSSATIDKLTAVYIPNTTMNFSGGPGMTMDITANQYNITFTEAWTSTPTLMLERLDSNGDMIDTAYSWPTQIFSYENLGTYVNLNQSFTFSLPPGWTAPFRLTVV